MATIRERSPGVWQVRVVTGRNGTDRPSRMAVTVPGGKREASCEAARLESTPQRGTEGRTVADALSAWLERNEGSYTPASPSDQTGRIRPQPGGRRSETTSATQGGRSDPSVS